MEGKRRILLRDVQAGGLEIGRVRCGGGGRRLEGAAQVAASSMRARGVVAIGCTEWGGVVENKYGLNAEWAVFVGKKRLTNGESDWDGSASLARNATSCDRFDDRKRDSVAIEKKKGGWAGLAGTSSRSGWLGRDFGGGPFAAFAVFRKFLLKSTDVSPGRSSLGLLGVFIPSSRSFTGELPPLRARWLAGAGARNAGLGPCEIDEMVFV